LAPSRQYGNAPLRSLPRKKKKKKKKKKIPPTGYLLAVT